MIDLGEGKVECPLVGGVGQRALERYSTYTYLNVLMMYCGANYTQKRY
jgi:hypothetical protein